MNDLVVDTFLFSVRFPFFLMVFLHSMWFKMPNLSSFVFG